MSYVKSEWVAPGQGDSAYGILRWCNALGAMVGTGEDRHGKEDGLLATMTDLRIVGDGPPCDYDFERALEALDRVGLLTSEVLGRIDFVRRVARNPERSVIGVAGYVMALLLTILAAGSAQAGTYRMLDIVSVPAIPADHYIRHVQILHQTESWEDDAPDIMARIQHATRINAKEAQALAVALESWAQGNEPPPGPFWKSTRKDNGLPGKGLYELSVFSRPGPNRYAVMESSGLSYMATERQFCPIGCYPTISFEKQRMVLTEAEALELADALFVWLGGEDPADAIIWAKTQEAAK